MNSKSKENANSFFRRWVIATVAGWIAGPFIFAAVAMLEEKIGLSGETAIGLGMGGAVGFFQWRVGRKWFGASPQWLWGSLLGCTIPFIFYDLISTFIIKNAEILSSEYRIHLFVVCSGLLAGLWQQRMLFPYTTRANWWVLFSIAGWFLAELFFVTVIIPGHPETTVEMIRNLVTFPLAGLVQGLITGVSLKWLLTPEMRKA